MTDPLAILCWGDVGHDVYLEPPATLPGGCALNVAWSLALAGAEGVGVAGWVGDDGGDLRAQLRARGVDVRWLRQAPGATPCQRIRLRADGEREFCGYDGGVILGRGAPDAELGAALGQAGLVQIPVFDHTRPWAEWAWGQGLPLALDLMDLTDVDLAFALEALGRAQVVSCGLDAARDAERIARLEAEAAKPGRALLVITLGAEGARAVHGEQRVRVPAVAPPGPVVDTTGCGDAFGGTFLAARLAGASLEQALHAGARRGAEVAAHLGAVRLGPLSDGQDAPIVPDQDAS